MDPKEATTKATEPEQPVNKNLKKLAEDGQGIVAKLRRDTPRGAKVFPQFHKQHLEKEQNNLKKLPPHVREPRFSRLKSNSTSTLYVKNTITSPDDEEIVRCMSVALYYHIQKGHSVQNPNFIDVFSEKLYPLTNGFIELEKTPEVETVYKFVSTIFHAEKLALECIILCLVLNFLLVTFFFT
eukprot:TRINITY_DN957_c0_g1_i6.p1 TRINITY_DN957_c0_g1~~TRINITY_DN957_c0_g1_i6.p1  ORF type:complete len:183 (-),score=26.18 TRINITY_DN957_c0_g1_i6:947-1495(-)